MFGTLPWHPKFSPGFVVVLYQYTLIYKEVNEDSQGIENKFVFLPLKSVCELLANTIFQLLINYFAKTKTSEILMKVPRFSLAEQTDHVFNCKWAVNIWDLYIWRKEHYLYLDIWEKQRFLQDWSEKTEVIYFDLWVFFWYLFLWFDLKVKNTC